MKIWTNCRITMAASCYCCSMRKGKMQISEKMPMEIDLDVALHELGMLSTITNSRKEYLREKSRRDKHAFIDPLDDSLCLLQMNSKFVTNFSFSKSSAKGAKSDSQEPAENTSSDCNVEYSSSYLRRRRFKCGHRPYLYRPYDFPWRTKLEESLSTSTSVACPASPEPVVITGLSRQDSGNKSNPGSPVKSQKTAASSSGCSIFRSRSLDDLEFSKLDLSDGCSSEAGRAEIDTVSQRISKLHVS